MWNRQFPDLQTFNSFNKRKWIGSLLYHFSSAHNAPEAILAVFQVSSRSLLFVNFQEQNPVHVIYVTFTYYNLKVASSCVYFFCTGNTLYRGWGALFETNAKMPWEIDARQNPKLPF